jgi:signal transduction histidine kinase
MKEQKKRKSIQRRIVFSILISGFLAAVGGAFIVTWKETDQLMETIGSQFESLAKANGHEADAIMLNEISHLHHYADSLQIRRAVERANERHRGLSDAEIEAQLAREEQLWENERKGSDPRLGVLSSEGSRFLQSAINEKKENRGEVSLFVTNKRGTLVASLDETPQYRHAEETWWRGTYDQGRGKEYISDLYVDPVTKTNLIDIAVPVTNEQSREIIGILKISIDVRWFFDPFINHITFGQRLTGHAMLIESSGKVIICPILATGSHVTDLTLLTQITSPASGWASVKNDAHGGETFLMVFDPIVGFSPVSEVSKLTVASGAPRWHSFIRQHPTEIYIPIENLLIWMTLSGGVGVAMLGILGGYSSRKIVAPILQLQKSVDLTRMGKPAPVVEIHTNDEIQSLSEAFTAMSSELQDAFATLEEKVEERTNQLKEAQAKLIETERLASVGQIAAFVAHELRNPLGVIKNASYYLKAKALNHPQLDDPKFIKHLMIIESEVIASAKIIEGLLSFSRTVPLNLSPTDLDANIDDALSAIGIPEAVKVVRKKDPNLPPVLVDADQMRRVFINLIRNAVEAMPAGGELKIDSRREEDKVIIDFSDTGAGIDPKNRPKLFQAFFTTKAHGTGLGLAMVKKIIDGHHGEITVKTETGIGTTFSVILTNTPTGSLTH